MSMVPSGIGMANPFSPLHQSLIRTMPNSALIGQPQSPIPQSDQDNTLMRAHNLRAGKPGNGQMTPDDRMGGPAGQSIAKYKAMMAMAAGLTDEDKDKFKPALDDPAISPQALQQLLQMHARVKAGQQPPQQPPAAGNQPSIGGPTPANVPQGSMRITQGSGRDGRAVMSQDALAAWQQRAQQTAPQGEQVHQISGSYTPTLSKAGMDEWNRSNPGQPLPTRSTPVQNAGFQVNGIQPPAQSQPAPAANPMAGLFQAFKQAGIDDNGLSQLQAYSQAGATPQQVHQAAQQMLSQQQSGQQRQHAEQQQMQQHQQQQQQHQQDMQIRQLQHQQTLASQMGDQETVGKLQGQIDGLMKPQQQQQAQAQQPQHPQPTQPVSQPHYELGQTLNTPRGPVMVIGYDHDGHPLIQPAGR